MHMTSFFVLEVGILLSRNKVSKCVLSATKISAHTSEIECLHRLCVSLYIDLASSRLLGAPIQKRMLSTHGLSLTFFLQAHRAVIHLPD